MRHFYRIGSAAALIAALGGCSFQAALDKMVSPERQKDLVATGERFCTDPPSVKSQLHPEIATSVEAAAPALPRECPDGKASWQLASYNWKTNVTPGLKERQEEVVVVGTTGKGNGRPYRCASMRRTTRRCRSPNGMCSAARPNRRHSNLSSNMRQGQRRCGSAARSCCSRSAGSSFGWYGGGARNAPPDGYSAASSSTGAAAATVRALLNVSTPSAIAPVRMSIRSCT